MNTTIQELYQFQLLYLKQILENIPEQKLFAAQEEGLNSAGWILGHLIVEADDVFTHLKTNIEAVPQLWTANFKSAKTWNKQSFVNLPTKQELVKCLEFRYNLMLDLYSKLSDQERLAPHPSKMLAGFYTNLDTWIAHHLITHFAIHCGNITTWKKTIGLEVQGF